MLLLTQHARFGCTDSIFETAQQIHLELSTLRRTAHQTALGRVVSNPLATIRWPAEDKR